MHDRAEGTPRDGQAGDGPHTTGDRARPGAPADGRDVERPDGARCKGEAIGVVTEVDLRKTSRKNGALQTVTAEEMTSRTRVCAKKKDDARADIITKAGAGLCRR